MNTEFNEYRITCRTDDGYGYRDRVIHAPSREEALTRLAEAETPAKVLDVRLVK